MTALGLHCVTCGADIDPQAPFCRRCGSEPLLGGPWPETAGLSRDDEGTLRFPEGPELRSATEHEVLTALGLHAWVICTTEERASRRLCERAPRFNPVARRRHRRELALEVREVHAALDIAVPALHATCEELIRRAHEELDIGSAEEFIERFPLAEWIDDHFGCYLCMGSEAELTDVWRRRVVQRLALHGLEDEQTLAPEERGWRVRFNALLLTPVAPDSEWVTSVADALMGESGVRETTAAALLPLAWRRWEDETLAPVSGVIVRVADDPLAAAGIEDPDWAGDRRGACRALAARLRGLYEQPVVLEPAEVGGRPAVRCAVLREVEEGRTVRFEHVFVRAGEQTYHVFGFSPLWEREYASAVHSAVEEFSVAA